MCQSVKLFYSRLLLNLVYTYIYIYASAMNYAMNMDSSHYTILCTTYKHS